VSRVENITRSIAFQCAGLKPGVTGGAQDGVSARAEQHALKGVPPYTPSRTPLHGFRVCSNVKSWAERDLRVPPAAARLLLKEMAGGRNAGHGGSDDGTHGGRSRSGRGPAVPRGNPQRRLSQEPYV